MRFVDTINNGWLIIALDGAKSSGTPELAPQPSLDEADTLLKPARDAGLATWLCRHLGQPCRLKVSAMPRQMT